MENTTMSEELVRAVNSCKDLKTCTLDELCAPLIVQKQDSLLRMQGTFEQLALAQVVYYAQGVCELSSKHTQKQDAFMKLMDVALRTSAVKKAKEKKEDANDGAGRTRVPAQAAG